MSDPKAKSTKKPAKKKEEPSFVKEVGLNTKDIKVVLAGEEVELTVSDLDLMDISILMAKYSDVLGQLVFLMVDGEEPTAADVMFMIGQVENPRSKLAFTMALCCGLEQSAHLFMRLDDDTYQTILSAMHDVVDFERIKQVFLNSPLLKKFQKK